MSKETVSPDQIITPVIARNIRQSWDTPAVNTLADRATHRDIKRSWVKSNIIREVRVHKAEVQINGPENVEVERTTERKERFVKRLARTAFHGIKEKVTETAERFTPRTKRLAKMAGALAVGLLAGVAVGNATNHTEQHVSQVTSAEQSDAFKQATGDSLANNPDFVRYDAFSNKLEAEYGEADGAKIAADMLENCVSNLPTCEAFAYSVSQ